MKIIILCGGSGTRLWPLSRESFPKQFLRIFSERSLFQETVLRALRLVGESEITVITGERYRWIVTGELEELGAKGVKVLTEPAGRNTAPAVALGIKYLLDLGESHEESVLVLPSDHLIKDTDRFVEAVKSGVRLTQEGYLVLFGEHPAYPETGYGYIKLGKGVHSGYEVERFEEKPSRERAEEYVRKGGYLWNCGIFLFSLGRILEDYERFFPEVDFQLSLEDFLSRFPYLPDISFDYAILEKTERIAVVPLRAGWSDVGSWKAVYENMGKDERGNVRAGDTVTIDTEGSLVFSQGGRILACIGVRDCLVINSEDATLIMDKESAQRVREVVALLKERKDRRVYEAPTCFTPFGKTVLLDEGSDYRIKKVVVKPGAEIPLQMHHHRTKHWIVLRGTAKVTLEAKTFFVHENESFFVRKSQPYRIENVGKIPLEMIEVQSGEYLGEDDVELIS
ncbi:MAG: mannose-1-phosphate guanylyltransferase/mannose-6-phosphate isomerase [Aquificota bacterium]|nr:mannose-1-phosphate guanylyltransferase/mannose-6-phosphate isomerase [Aquificota bacterium]